MSFGVPPVHFFPCFCLLIFWMFARQWYVTCMLLSTALFLHHFPHEMVIGIYSRGHMWLVCDLCWILVLKLCLLRFLFHFFSHCPIFWLIICDFHGFIFINQVHAQSFEISGKQHLPQQIFSWSMLLVSWFRVLL